MALPRIVRFGITGLLNTGWSYAVYAFFLWLGLRFELANFLACLAGILVGYFTHLRFVFADANSPRLWRYVVVWVALYGLNIALIYLLMRLGLNAYVAGALAMPCIVLTSYGLNRVVVFRVKT
jgi:putative flippase GtrA